MVNKEAAKEFVKFLNEVHKIDPEWTKTMVEYRPGCNKELAEHPTLMAWDNQDGTYKAGLLGLLNGLFFEQEEVGSWAVRALYDDEKDVLMGFQYSKFYKGNKVDE